MQRLYAFLLLFLNAVLWVLVAIISPLYLLLHALYQTCKRCFVHPEFPRKRLESLIKTYLKKGKEDLKYPASLLK